MFISLVDYVKTIEYLEKALAIAIEIGDRQGEGSCYGNLATVFKSLGYYVKANECIQKSLAIAIEIGDRKGEVSSYLSLGTVFESLGDYVKAKESQAYGHLWTWGVVTLLPEKITQCPKACVVQKYSSRSKNENLHICNV